MVSSPTNPGPGVVCCWRERSLSTRYHCVSHSCRACVACVRVCVCTIVFVWCGRGEAPCQPAVDVPCSSETGMYRRETAARYCYPYPVYPPGCATSSH